MRDGKGRNYKSVLGKRTEISKIDRILIFNGIFILFFYMCLIPQMEVVNILELLNIGFILSVLIVIALTYIVYYMCIRELYRLYDEKNSREYEEYLKNQKDDFSADEILK